jgi:hypothetical protein
VTGPSADTLASQLIKAMERLLRLERGQTLSRGEMRSIGVMYNQARREARRHGRDALKRQVREFTRLVLYSPRIYFFWQLALASRSFLLRALAVDGRARSSHRRFSDECG